VRQLTTGNVGTGGMLSGFTTCSAPESEFPVVLAVVAVVLAVVLAVGGGRASCIFA
jgi:hypothetical protein